LRYITINRTSLEPIRRQFNHYRATIDLILNYKGEKKGIQKY